MTWGPTEIIAGGAVIALGAWFTIYFGTRMIAEIWGSLFRANWISRPPPRNRKPIAVGLAITLALKLAWEISNLS